MRIKSIIFIIISSLIISGCLNIKSKYPDIICYKLQNPPLQNEFANSILDKNIFIKTFSIPTELETTKIIINNSENTIKQYNYQQWTAPLNDVLTDFTINRFNQYNIFKKGIVTSIYSATPDIVLECNVIECSINYHSKNVTLTIAATLLIENSSTLDYSPVFSKTYQQITPISNKNIGSASNAIAISLAKIDDNILTDIIEKCR